MTEEDSSELLPLDKLNLKDTPAASSKLRKVSNKSHSNKFSIEGVHAATFNASCLAPLFILKMYIHITQKLAQNSRGCKISWNVQDSHLNLGMSEDYVVL
jgi:hypothetical protein